MIMSFHLLQTFRSLRSFALGASVMSLFAMLFVIVFCWELLRATVCTLVLGKSAAKQLLEDES